MERVRLTVGPPSEMREDRQGRLETCHAQAGHTQSSGRSPCCPPVLLLSCFPTRRPCAHNCLHNASRSLQTDLCHCPCCSRIRPLCSARGLKQTQTRASMWSGSAEALSPRLTRTSVFERGWVMNASHKARSLPHSPQLALRFWHLNYYPCSTSRWRKLKPRDLMHLTRATQQETVALLLPHSSLCHCSPPAWAQQLTSGTHPEQMPLDGHLPTW